MLEKCEWSARTNHHQCDQIWRNFATLAKVKIIGNDLGFLGRLWKILNLLFTIFNAIGQRPFLLLSKYIKPSGHTAPPVKAAEVASLDLETNNARNVQTCGKEETCSRDAELCCRLKSDHSRTLFSLFTIVVNCLVCDSRVEDYDRRVIKNGQARPLFR